ncbi:MAG: adenylate/guanylate cyclase domain-containing protein, partial [Rhodospirillales bacterium]
IVKDTGDGLLAAFDSVVDAVRCAAEVQRALDERNRAAPEDQRVAFRLGINVGDVIVDGGDIYGDGVNVAARLEAIADPGGICVSARVREDAAGHVPFEFEDMGERALKNIARPVRAFRVRLDRPDAPAGAGAALPSFGDRPTFAVLPFANMSGDAAHEYFADGISEDLIAAVSGWCRFPVIARNSSFAYKGRAVDVKQAGRELGARYVVEGSVRKSGDRLRVSAQLIDAESGHQIWSGRYDRSVGDVFAIQDEITASIAAAVEPELREVEERRAARAGRPSLAAYDLVQRGNWHHNRFTPKDAEEAQRLFAAAIDADPDYAPAYASMAYTKYWAAQMRWSADGAATLRSAQEFARRAVALDDKDARAHMYLGQVSLWLRQHDNAIVETRRALELNPSLAQAYSVLGYALDCVGEFDEALKTVTHSLRLRPNDRTLARCLPALSVAHYQLGAYDRAEDIARRAVTMNPIYWMGHQMLAASLGQLGRKDEAAQELAEIRRREPDVERDAYSGRLPFRDPQYARRIEDGLIKAGWM